MESPAEGSSPARGTPKFKPRKGVLSREYYVLVEWPDGRRTKVGRFSRKPDAARWIARNSSDWLAQQPATGNLQ